MDINKEKCKYLKKVRKSLADKLNVDLHQTECTYEGKCSGTCPKCQQEERILNKAILKRGALATAVAATAMTLTGCNSTDIVQDTIINVMNTFSQKQEELSGAVAGPDEYVLEGEVAYFPEDSEACTSEATESVKTESNTDGDIEEIIELTGDVPYEPYG